MFFILICFIISCLLLHAWSERIRGEVKYRLKDVLIHNTAQVTYKRNYKNYDLVMIKINNKDIPVALKVNVINSNLSNLLNIDDKIEIKMIILNFEPIFSSWTLFVNKKYKHYLKRIVIIVNGVEYDKGFTVNFY